MGSINMDYRSFYHHFENGIYIYNASVIDDIEKDILDCLKECQEDTLEVIRNEKPWVKFIGAIGRLIAPMI